MITEQKENNDNRTKKVNRLLYNGRIDFHIYRISYYCIKLLNLAYTNNFITPNFSFCDVFHSNCLKL